MNLIPCNNDIDGDGILNDCDIDQSAGEDCNTNGIIDSCDIAGGAADANTNGIPDECEETPFIRGDVNGDGGIDIGDAVTTLDYLFTGGSIGCEKAADSNDDGAINVADGIALLGYLFSGTGDLPMPFPTCGGDLTADTLVCEIYEGCP
ncbi:dockerin type I domain-containing protein [Planctomycetota bacterium]|nr:dockerin type I domain-containing protein [Planctomycetota bacterium]